MNLSPFKKTDIYSWSSTRKIRMDGKKGSKKSLWIFYDIYKCLFVNVSDYKKLSDKVLIQRLTEQFLLRKHKIEHWRTWKLDFDRKNDIILWNSAVVCTFFLHQSLKLRKWHVLFVKNNSFFSFSIGASREVLTWRPFFSEPHEATKCKWRFHLFLNWNSKTA